MLLQSTHLLNGTRLPFRLSRDRCSVCTRASENGVNSAPDSEKGISRRGAVLQTAGLITVANTPLATLGGRSSMASASVVIGGVDDGWAETDYRRMLHSVSVVKDLNQTQDFYTNILGMKKLRYRSFEDGSANGFSGVLSEKEGFSLELVQKAETPDVKVGTDFRHWGIRVNDVSKTLAAAKRAKWPVFTGTEAGEVGKKFVEDPSGYRWRITEGRDQPGDPFFEISVRVSDLDRSVEYYTKTLGMTVIREESGDGYKQACVCWGSPQDNTQLELTELLGRMTPIDTGSSAYIQIAVSTDDVFISEKQIKDGGGTITREAAPVPGIGTKVMKAADPDGWVVAFVDYADFLAEL